MEDTGRIKRALMPEAVKILYGLSDDSIEKELKYMTRIDKAHIIMMARANLILPVHAVKLLSAIKQLENDEYLPLKGKDTPRGIYMLYEDYLIEQLGIEVGGLLQLGRSRNDLKASAQLLRLRPNIKALLFELLELANVLSSSSLMLRKSAIIPHIIGRK